MLGKLVGPEVEFGEEELIAFVAVHPHLGMSFSHVGPKPFLVQIRVSQILFSTNDIEKLFYRSSR